MTDALKQIDSGRTYSESVAVNLIRLSNFVNKIVNYILTQGPVLCLAKVAGVHRLPHAALLQEEHIPYILKSFFSSKNIFVGTTIKPMCHRTLFSFFHVGITQQQTS